MGKAREIQGRKGREIKELLEKTPAEMSADQRYKTLMTLEAKHPYGGGRPWEPERS